MLEQRCKDELILQNRLQKLSHFIKYYYLCFRIAITRIDKITTQKAAEDKKKKTIPKTRYQFIHLYLCVNHFLAC